MKTLNFMKASHLCFLLAIFLSLPCQAQQAKEEQHVSSQPTERRPWQLLFDQMCDYDDIEDNNAEDMYEQLCELEASPVDLNHATPDDLQRLFFLNDHQREQLAEYVDRYRPLRSEGELSLIESLDPLRLQLLRCFTVVAEGEDAKTFPSLKRILKYGKHELVATAKIPLYERAGDRNGYLGYKYKHWIRYKFQYSNNVSLGFTGAQDSGEPFFASCNKTGYDHYAYWLLVRDMGRLKTLALGQYKVRLGLGLVVNSGFTFGKTASAVLSQPNYALTANTSRSEASYLQGGAATLALSRHLDATVFLSYRKIDATLNDDGSIKTILRTGYHRTQSEIARRHNASQFASGANISWRDGGFHAGLTALFTSFSRRLTPDDSRLYLRYAPNGKSFANASLNYGYICHRLTLNGETAVNDAKALATLNTVSWQASNTLSLTAIQRYYSYKYYSLFSSSFSDAGKTQNESGIYAGATWQPLPRLSLLAYCDYAYHPWARYRVSTSSHSLDNSLQATYTFSPSLSLSARYRLRLRQEDYTQGKQQSSSLIDKTEHRSRLTLAYSGKRLTCKTQVDFAYTTFPAGLSGKTNSLGWMATQSAGAQISLFSTYVAIGYFHTDDYNSRLYSYERGTLYNFSSHMFYGKGMRVAAVIRADIGKKLMVVAKAATTKYFDRDHISSSYQQINSSAMTDIDVQIKWKF